MTLFPCKCPCTLYVDGVRMMGDGEGERGEKIKCPLAEEYQKHDTIKIAGDSGARTSCAGCDDEAVYTIGWMERRVVRNAVSSRGIIGQSQGRGRFRRPNEFDAMTRYIP